MPAARSAIRSTSSGWRKKSIRLLTEATDLGAAYRVDLRLRPEGSHGPLCLSFDSTLSYYDVKGRTWERQAFVKARPIAGDRDLGRELLARLEPWIYRKYLSLADITGIKSLKRRIEQRAEREGGELRNVKTGHGGIRDIEFVIQFLQLLNGGALPEVRTGNTLEAIARLEKAGCLTPDERAKLEDNYNMLRKLEHRLQIMFDLQDAPAADDRDELARLAVRMGYAGTRHMSPLRGVSGRLRAAHAAEPRDARSPAAQRLSRRRRRGAGSRSRQRSRPAAGADSAKCSAAIRSTTFRPRTKT